jgi:hypothetical protein
MTDSFQLREQGIVDPSASLSERDVIFVKELIKGRGNGGERAGRDHSKTVGALNPVR